MEMNTRFLLPMGLIVLLLLSSCTVGSRQVVSEEREVSNFERVDFSGIGELTITQGDSEGLTIEAESNIIRRIKSEVRGGTLRIWLESGLFGFSFVPTKPIRYDLTVKDLTALDLSGLGNVYAGAIDTDRLNLGMSGAGKTVIRALNADTLVVEYSGLGSCELAGRVRSQQILFSGGGEYDAADLESESIELEVSGLGKATVWANESLDIKVSGAGSVGYYGNPRVSQDVSGLGSVRSLGSR